MPDDADFGSFGRYVEIAVEQMPAEMRDAYDFTRSLRGLVPGPHRIWVANPALSKTIVPTGAYFQAKSTLTKAEIEIVTLLITSRWRSAYASYEHEKIAIGQVHLDPGTVKSVVTGLPAEFDDPRAAIVYELASALVQSRIVSNGLFRDAKVRLGVAGIIDVAVLIGWTMVSMTLPHSTCRRMRTARRWTNNAPSRAITISDRNCRRGIAHAGTPASDSPRGRGIPTSLFPGEHGGTGGRIDACHCPESKGALVVPAAAPSGLVQPALLHTFEFNTTFVVEWKPEIFLLGVADVYATQEARLYAIDLRHWQHGHAIQPRLMLQMPQPWAGFNGAALIAPDVLIAAGIAGLLWRIELATDGTASARVWLEHDSMKNRPGEMKPEQPGANGVQSLRQDRLSVLHHDLATDDDAGEGRSGQPGARQTSPNSLLAGVSGTISSSTMMQASHMRRHIARTRSSASGLHMMATVRAAASS